DRNKYAHDEHEKAQTAACPPTVSATLHVRQRNQHHQAVVLKERAEPAGQQRKQPPTAAIAIEIAPIATRSRQHACEHCRIGKHGPPVKNKQRTDSEEKCCNQSGPAIEFPFHQVSECDKGDDACQDAPHAAEPFALAEEAVTQSDESAVRWRLFD